MKKIIHGLRVCARAGGRLSLAAVLALLALVAFAGTARAGTVHVRDEARVLSSDDVARLRAAVGAAPFDARLAVTNEYPDARDFVRYVESIVNEPNMVAVGIDPQRRHVEVRFGTGSHVARAERPAIERAGNDAFRRGDYGSGAIAIFHAAAAAVQVDPGSAPVTVPQDVPRPSFFGPGLLLLLVAGAIGVGVWFARRRSAMGPPVGPGYGQGYGPGYGPGPMGGPGYYPPGYPQQGGMGPLGGGIIGAGLGGLAGYELGKMEGEREERELDRGGAVREVEPDRGGNFDDGGGGGSSWDDGGGDGGGGGGDGFDGGGGGSDF